MEKESIISGIAKSLKVLCERKS